MVKRGLKAGETFEDGGFTYEVKKVNHDGSYESKRVIPAKQDTAAKSEKTETAEKSGGRKGKSAQ